MCKTDKFKYLEMVMQTNGSSEEYLYEKDDKVKVLGILCNKRMQIV